MILPLKYGRYMWYRSRFSWAACVSMTLSKATLILLDESEEARSSLQMGAILPKMVTVYDATIQNEK